MPEKNNNNPLKSPQREKQGAETFGSYTYQYHWALQKVFELHEEIPEYAVFVELHEDVVSSNSLDASKAEFDFNQIKTTNRVFSSNEILKVSKKKPNSILGKLLQTCTKKDFASKIVGIALVSVKGFKLEQTEKELSLEKIQLEDLTSKQLNVLKASILKELGLTTLPETLHFVTPNLSELNTQEVIIGIISNVITRLHPGQNYNPVEIYRILIDELYKKGTVTYDYKKWDELLKNKALTSNTVTTVINSFTSVKDEEKILSEFNQIAGELGMNSIKKLQLKLGFERYRQSRLKNNSTNQIDITKEIVEAIQLKISNGEEDIKNLITDISSELSEKTKEKLVFKDELKGAIICEFIMISNG